MPLFIIVVSTTTMREQNKKKKKQWRKKGRSEHRRETAWTSGAFLRWAGKAAKERQKSEGKERAKVDNHPHRHVPLCLTIFFALFFFFFCEQNWARQTLNHGGRSQASGDINCTSKVVHGSPTSSLSGRKRRRSLFVCVGMMEKQLTGSRLSFHLFACTSNASRPFSPVCMR